MSLQRQTMLKKMSFQYAHMTRSSTIGVTKACLQASKQDNSKFQTR